jgi:hypothetical protein
MTVALNRLASLVVVGALVAGCGGAVPSAAPQTAAPSLVGEASATPAATPLDELDQLDDFVRARHPGPFLIHPESEWTAKLAEIRPKLAATTDPDERFALVASLVGLLDTHSFLALNAGFHEYPVFLYHFTEGWFVIAALDKTLIGARVVSISGHPIADVEAALRPLVPHDNEMGFLLNVQQPLSVAEYLHGAGIVADPAKPSWAFQLPDGTQRTDDFAAISDDVWGSSLNIVGMLVGTETEAVRRHTELSWSRVDAKRRVMLITVNDYGDETTVIEALKKALDAKQIDRLVLDIRFLPGGSGDFRLLDVIKAEPRINKPGALTVLIGRENFSIADAIVRDFDVNSKALLVGEPTPALADNFRCDCVDLRLKQLGVTVTIPTWRDKLGDDRQQVDPDVRMDLAAADFFAGKDPVLDAALAGIKAP